MFLEFKKETLSRKERSRWHILETGTENGDIAVNGRRRLLISGGLRNAG